MRATTLTATLALALSIKASHAAPQPISEFKLNHAVEERPLIGWAIRLDIPLKPEIQPQQDQLGRPYQSLAFLQDESSSPFVLAKYILYKTWQWVFQQDTAIRTPTFKPKAAWNDTAPRRVRAVP